MTYTADDDTAGTAAHNRLAELADDPRYAAAPDEHVIGAMEAAGLDVRPVAALEDELRRPDDVTTAARDTAAAILDDCRQTRAALYELAELATVPLYREEQRAARRVERLESSKGRTRYAGDLERKTAEARAELEKIRRALELAREHNPTRRAILAKAG